MKSLIGKIIMIIETVQVARRAAELHRLGRRQDSLKLLSTR